MEQLREVSPETVCVTGLPNVFSFPSISWYPSYSGNLLTLATIVGAGY
jgi:hypothetical protein